MLFFFRSLEFSLKYLCYVFASFNSFFQGTTALEWRTKNTPCIYISYGFYALRGWQSFLNSVTGLDSNLRTKKFLFTGGRNLRK